MSDEDNPLLTYYDAEMRYLREASKEFAAAQPDAARRLGLTSLGEREDSVEQVYQGFAFLMARMRAKLDDALPEITDPLIDNLWPHAGRTIPSLAILECVPRAGEARVLGTLPAGIQVRSGPVGPEGTVCTYRTTQPVRLLPLELVEAGSAVRADGRTVIRIAFELLHFGQRPLDDLARIRLYLHGDRPTASALYAAFTRQVEAIAVRMARIQDGRPQPLPRMTIKVAGFGPETRLWPSDHERHNRELDREQTMLEYFTFPEKFHFVDLCGFDAASVPAGETRIEFEVLLNGPLAGDVAFGTRNLRLFCTPVINLFEIDAQPLQPNEHDRDYLVRAPDADGAHIEPYDALSVAATDLNSAEQHAYRSFKTFQHRGGMLRHEAPERYFHASLGFGVTGGRQMWITLGGHVWDKLGDAPGSPPDTHVKVRVLANNGTLPRTALRESTITTLASSAGDVGSVRNLTQPTLPLYPPRDGQYRWQVMSHFSGHEFNTLDTDVLRGVLALYDWTGLDDNAGRIAAIRRVRLEQRGVLRKGGMVREFAIHVEIDPAGFAGPGDVVLFGDVLSHFVGRYASYHYSVRLVLVANGKETAYPATEFTGSGF
ncbi:type VI secretion system baseplate subunit TssF [Cupriavidus basilensis]|uniref:type VI secretion system baseplate subunit TssF n=1 Tax=Cupriavidus basilensis TaxID=68895 RepID=UPI0023E8E819|nr:type VI secretion system baseplate subunit TssF [Cupriavidus basilensis]MDF3884870.1 type VI secretion system baseplate subunit TssF [Cupriavidus basilensis]